jgi:hypothetical protein
MGNNVRTLVQGGLIAIGVTLCVATYPDYVPAIVAMGAGLVAAGAVLMCRP